jgi:hypothetical protein
MTTPTRTCGECRHHNVDEYIKCRAPLPIWVYNLEWNTQSKDPAKVNDQATWCDCFKPKDEEEKGPETT